MTLTVEDGSGITDAESFASVQFFRDYFAARNVVTTQYTDAQVEGALRVATDFITVQYIDDWQGLTATADQALAWPRTGVRLPDRWTDVPSDIVPVMVQRATSELALLELADKLYDTPVAAGFVTEETVGPITTKYVQTGGTVSGDVTTTHPKIDAMLLPFFDNGGAYFPVDAVRG